MSSQLKQEDQEAQGLGKSLQEVQEAQVPRAHGEEGDIPRDAGTSYLPQIRQHQQ